MIPENVLRAVAAGPLPAYIHESGITRARVILARGLLDDYLFPIKACPEHAIVRCAVETGAGLDLCSLGDTVIAEESGCPGARWSCTTPHAPPELLARLLARGAMFDADSLEQAEAWRKIGGRRCGLRIASADADSAYGAKFGIPAEEIEASAAALARSGLTIDGLHLHESHAGRTPDEMIDRLASLLLQAGRTVLGACAYVNVGGGWPMPDGRAADVADIAPALQRLRARLDAAGFAGRLIGEPGEWVVGPTGFWAAHVSAVKRHPGDPRRRVVILDTSTPVPCRPSHAAFAVVRDGAPLAPEASGVAWDVFGSANTATDAIGLGVDLPAARPGDVVVSCGQGAYARSLTGSFNERPIPAVVVV